MRAKIYALMFLAAFLLLPLINANAEIEYSRVPMFVNDFEVSYSLLNESGKPLLGPIDGVTLIRISPDSLNPKTKYRLTVLISKLYLR